MHRCKGLTNFWNPKILEDFNLFHGKSMKKQSSTKQGPYGASAQQRHGLQQTGGSCSSLGKTRKGVFSRIKKTLQLYHWLKRGIGMIICIYWLEE